MNNIEFWTVENTGWSNKTSWFPSGGSYGNPFRFDSFKEASRYAKKSKKVYDDANCLWRVVHTTIERFENKEVITNEWTRI